LRYHGVTHDPAANGPWLTRGPLSVTAFRAQLEVLSRRYHVISLEEALAILSGQSRPRPYSVVLTFDDGYRNNATAAYPVLRDLGLPATIFVATDFVSGHRPLWFDRLEYALAHTTSAELVLTIRGIRRLYPLATTADRVHAFRDLLAEFKQTDLAASEALLVDIERQSRCIVNDVWDTDDRVAPMTWEHVRELHSRGITIGNHTGSHQILTVLDEARAREEVARATNALERHLGTARPFFAYPNGDHSPATEQILRQQSFACAVTTLPRSAARGDNLLAVPRIAAGQPRDPYKFLAELSGLFPYLLALRRRLRARRQPDRAGALTHG
jgi:peptidoglycan/xylan/chitin deacetylase (PgdA/CDA1 family)